jgi:nitroreductase
VSASGVKHVSELQRVNTFKERRSARSFKDTSLPRDVLRELLESGNSQNVDWVVLDNKNRIQDLRRQTVLFLAKMSRLLRNPFT